MTAKIIDGKAIAAEVRETVVRLGKKTEVLENGLKPAALDQEIGSEKGLVIEWGSPGTRSELCKIAKSYHLG